MTADYRAGFRDLETESTIESLPVSGTVPEWLRGWLIRTTPARWDVKGRKLNHWFDGLAMLYSFSFEHGRVSFKSRFLQSEAYQAAQKSSEIRYKEFATNPRKSSGNTDNDNVNISLMAGEFVALSETNTPISFDPETLETRGHFKFEDGLKGQVSTAHPHFDFTRRESLNYLIDFSARSHYEIYRMPEADRGRQLIARIPVDRPAYMHSFAVTQNYVILAEFPLTVNPLDLAFGKKPFIDNYHWRPKDGTRFTVVARDSGKVNRIEHPAFFSFHHVNAYEQNGEIVLDMCVYEGASIVDALRLENIMTKEQAFPLSYLRRFILNLQSNTAASQQLSDRTIELPRINYPRNSTRPYRYVYGATTDNMYDFLNGAVKIDLQNDTAAVWHEAGMYPGEPVFVARPQSTEEDDGILLSMVLDSKAGSSFLLGMDARDLSGTFRASLPHHIPLGFHGNFYFFSV